MTPRNNAARVRALDQRQNSLYRWTFVLPLLLAAILHFHACPVATHGARAGWTRFLPKSHCCFLV